MKAAISIFVFLISAGMAVLYLVHVKEQQYATALAIEESPRFFCGTVSPLDESTKFGKQLFNANCAACHKLDSKSTGPAFRGIVIRYEEERSSSLDSFFYKRRFQRENNTNKSCFITPEITDTDIQNILHYTQ